MKTPLLVAAMILAAWADLAQATAIVIIRRGGELVVAADSKTSRTDDGADGANASLSCKISRCGDGYFAFSGLRRDVDGDFSLPSLAAQACKSPGTLLHKTRTFESLSAEPLSSVMGRIREVEPGWYQRNLDGKAAEVAFFGAEAGRSVVYVREVRMVEGASGLEARFLPVQCTEACIVFLGEADEMFSYYERHPELWAEALTEIAVRLIEIAAAANPRLVGLPISMIRLNDGAVRWLQRPPACR